MLLGAVGAAAVVAAAPLEAQLLRGTAVAAQGGRPISGARLVATLADGTEVGRATTDEAGRFQLAVTARHAPFTIAVTRVGLRPTRSNVLLLAPTDTLVADFEVEEVRVALDTLRVRGAPTLNEVRLREAERRGWRVFPPAEIAQHRERANSFEELLRSTGYPGFVISSRRNDCIRASRTNRCLLIVVDGVPLSGMDAPLINPRDVHFMALLSPNQAALQYGDRAPNGALAVWTRTPGNP
ncbi:MAG: carboxypeptidase regulatory-like domain-containing protein [Gemmatimonadetes bacterium]|nr:carboxypeptidase regulatory-like domain-containing protein [Gemmatimonadota bacterium]